MPSLLPTKKKALAFPLWAEVGLIIAALVMAAIEGLHEQWLWAVIFGICGIAFGVGAVGRILSGGKHDEA